MCYNQMCVSSGQEAARIAGHPAIIPPTGEYPPWQLSPRKKSIISSRYRTVIMPLGKSKPPNPIKYMGLKAAEWVMLQGDPFCFHRPILGKFVIVDSTFSFSYCTLQVI